MNGLIAAARLSAGPLDLTEKQPPTLLPRGGNIPPGHSPDRFAQTDLRAANCLNPFGKHAAAAGKDC